MIITQTGNYKLLKDMKTRGTISIGDMPEGTIIEITQIDNGGHKVIGPQLMDWTYWDLPVEPVSK